MIKYDAIIVASGKGERLNLGYNKVFYRFDDGMTILDKAMSLFIEDEDCQRIIVVTNEEDFKNVRLSPKVILTKGGKLRKDSVYAGIELIKSPYVLIHDGARPYLKKEDLDNLKQALSDNDACILAMKVKETVKYEKDGFIVDTLDRNHIFLAQTPQGFKSDLIRDAYQKADDLNVEFTDDSSIVEHFGVPVKIVEGSRGNDKITFKEDL